MHLLCHLFLRMVADLCAGQCCSRVNGCAVRSGPSQTGELREEVAVHLGDSLVNLLHCHFGVLGRALFCARVQTPIPAPVPSEDLMSELSDELPSDITRVLNEVDQVDRHAISVLLPIVYSDLRRLAASFFRSGHPEHTLQPTALVHEAFLRLVDGDRAGFCSREHFFRTAAVVMRHILVNRARDRGRQKRGGGWERQALHEFAETQDDRAIDLERLDAAMTRLADQDQRQARIVELRFFAGLSVAETAEVLGVSHRTIEREWTFAKAWLSRELDDGRSE